MTAHNTLGERITAFRDKHSISQAGLAKALSVPRSTIWRWETGKSKPSYDKLSELDTYIATIEQKS